jgi:ubiquinone/menaquinone biosynthesis C-methylase UbiE
MIHISQEKHPEKILKTAKAECLPFSNIQFKNTTSLHLMMHLNNELIRSILIEVHLVLKPGGRFIFDVPLK